MSSIRTENLKKKKKATHDYTTMMLCLSAAGGGRSTPLMMWTTPLDAKFSATVTCGAEESGPMNRPSLLLVMERFLNSKFWMDWTFDKSVDKYRPTRMWPNFCLFSGFRRVSSVPAGRLANASLVGAKSVNCAKIPKKPGEVKSSTRSAATTAVTRVLRSSTDCANSTMLGWAAATWDGGRRTPLMMWTTPFDAKLSAAITCGEEESGPMNRPSLLLVMERFLNSKFWMDWTLDKSVDKYRPTRMW